MDKKYRVASFFSGCGGLDLGFEGGFNVKHPSIKSNNKQKTSQFVKLDKTMFETVLACDIKKSAKKAWENHFKRQNVFLLESIVDLVKKAKTGEFNFPEADIVTGGFPCQDFSVAGKRNGFTSHKSHDNKPAEIDAPTIESRGMLYYWLREAISIIKPKIFIAENVKGLVSLGDIKDVIANDFRTINGGYFVLEPQVLHAADYGVPQSRERIFFIGIRMDILTDDLIKQIQSGQLKVYPEKTHNHSSNDFVSAYEYLNDLPEPEFATDLSQQHYSKAKWYGRHCQGQIEINLNGLAPTIRSEHHGNIEFRRLSQENGGVIQQEYHLQQRRLTVRECARLQTFPDDFEFVGDGISASEAYKLIGNAVPPLLAYQLAKSIESLLSKIALNKPNNLRSA